MKKKRKSPEKNTGKNLDVGDDGNKQILAAEDGAANFIGRTHPKIVWFGRVLSKRYYEPMRYIRDCD